MTTKVTSSVLANTAVTAGTYGGSAAIPVITVDPQGRLSSAANVSVTQTAVYANTGQLTANAATGVVAVGLATSGVVSGTYGSGTTTPIVTIDQYGRITGVTTTLITGGSAGIGATTYTRTVFTATASQTSFTVNYTVGYVTVYLNGVLLPAADYTSTSGTSIVLASGAYAGDIVEVFAYTVTLVNNVSPSYTGGQGGSAGQVLYQSAANTTSNTDVGTSSYLLTSGGTGKPTWTNPGSLSVNAANTLSQGLWSVANTSNKLVFSYNSVAVFSIDSSGNMIAKGDVTGFGTP
jgi:hypothetical protein